MPSVRTNDTASGENAAGDTAIVDAVAALRDHGLAVVQDLFAPGLLSRLRARSAAARRPRHSIAGWFPQHRLPGAR